MSTISLVPSLGFTAIVILSRSHYPSDEHNTTRHETKEKLLLLRLSFLEVDVEQLKNDGRPISHVLTFHTGPVLLSIGVFLCSLVVALTRKALLMTCVMLVALLWPRVFSTVSFWSLRWSSPFFSGQSLHASSTTTSTNESSSSRTRRASEVFPVRQQRFLCDDARYYQSYEDANAERNYIILSNNTLYMFCSLVPLIIVRRRTRRTIDVCRIDLS